MNALVRKEVRLLTPSWIVALLLATLPVHLNLIRQPFGGPGLFTMLVWLGSVLLALSSFGREFSAGTFSQLLAQPVQRKRVWRVKVTLLATAIVSVYIAHYISLNLQAVGTVASPFFWMIDPSSSAKMMSDFLAIAAVMMLTAFAGSLWTVLLFRQTAAALWFVVLLPFAIVLPINLLVSDSQLANWLGGLALLFYSAVGYWFARWLFLRAQDTQWTGGEVSLPFFRRRTAEGMQPGTALGRQPLRALLWKEFQLHSVSLIFAGGVLLLHLAAIALRKLGADSQPAILQDVAKLMWVFWFVLPLIIGATAVASERQLGTMESQLCLPARRRTQFVIKLLFVLVAGVLLGGAMPWLLEHFAKALGTGSDLLAKIYTTGDIEERPVVPVLVTLSAFAAGLALVSFYASTLTRNTLQALGVSVLIGLLGVGLAAEAEYGPTVAGLRLWRGLLVHYLCWPAVGLTLLGLAYANYKRLHESGRLWQRNALAVALVLVAVSLVTTLVYHRVWELAMPLEPRHGPARLAGSVRPQIRLVGDRFFLLLPDGRLLGAKMDLRQGVPTVGAFVAGSNWVEIAAASRQLVGRQSDGSLWNIYEFDPKLWRQNQTLPLTPRRIGADSDWRLLAAQGRHCLALKEDGSLWGWGDNSYGQLGDGPKQMTNGPVRIGTNSDWVAVYAGSVKSVGVKRDGSVWRWGGLYYLPDGTRLKQTIRYPTPMRWNLPGTNLVSVQGFGGGDYALYSDGTIQAVGPVARGLVSASDMPAGRTEMERFFKTPVRVLTRGQWREIDFGGIFLGIQKDGSLWKQDAPWSWRPGEVNAPLRVSRYSDWIAVEACGEIFLAVAADGTLCCWASSNAYYRWDGRVLLLTLTRRPLWSMNIFADAE